MIMNKEEFCNVINEIQQIRLLQDKIDTAINSYRTDSTEGFFEFYFPTLEATLIHVLELIFHDEEYKNISWWVYDGKMGKEKPECLTITWPGNKTKTILTAGDLYDLLIEETERFDAANE